jgi:hypothetical protein
MKDARATSILNRTQRVFLKQISAATENNARQTPRRYNIYVIIETCTYDVRQFQILEVRDIFWYSVSDYNAQRRIKKSWVQDIVRSLKINIVLLDKENQLFVEPEGMEQGRLM